MNAARLGLMTLATLLLSAPALAEAVTIDWVTVGDPGNAADTTGYGGVAEAFRIGKYEITIGQYAEFLNAVAKTDPYSLYNESMATNLNIAGISRSGSNGSYQYSVIGPSGTTPAGASSPGNRPITYISWFDAARFANWMQNGQGLGNTEMGAYTLNGATSGSAPARSLGAQFYIPTEDQWYKAAFYKGGGANAGYWDYATQSDSPPGNVMGGATNQANYYVSGFAVDQSFVMDSNQNYLTDAGAFTNSLSVYGTFDQSGSVEEWTDFGNDTVDYGVIRGGSYGGTPFALSSSYRGTWHPAYHGQYSGFRLAAPVPEPSTYAMALAGIACGGYLVRRRRKQA